MNNALFSLAWQLFKQDYRTPHIRLLQFTQVLLVLFLLTLTLTSESVQKHLAQNMANLLGADVVISQFGKMPQENALKLAAHSSKVIFTQSIKTTLTHNGKWQQLTLKAVDNNYPLQGTVHVSNTLNTASYPVDSGPTPGEIWIGSRLAASLSIDVNQKLTLAHRQFVVAQILHHEPDRLMEGHNVDMRALIHREDFSALSFNDDNVEYRYLLNTSKAQTETLISLQKANMPNAELRHRHGAHPLALFWTRTENFLGLSFILLLFMATIAIYQISRIQIKAEQYFSAICLSSGATHSQGLFLSLLKWLLHILVLLPVTLSTSFLCHWAMINWLSGTLPTLQWQPNFHTGLLSFLSCAALLGLFQLPVWFSIKTASVKQLIFNRSGKAKSRFTLACLATSLTLVVLVYSDNRLLTAMLLGAMVCCVTLIAFLSWLSLTFGEKLTQRHSGLIPFATFMMKQRLMSKSTQIMGVGLCAFLLLFTLMLLRDVGNTMQSYSREFDGNVMVSQANAVQMDAVSRWVDKHGAEIRQQKPFMYAKLIGINDQSVDEFVTTPSGSLSTFQQAIRLHWTDDVPRNNRIIEGQWWQSKPVKWQQLSVEQEVMTDMGLNIGDQLSFIISGNVIDFTIVASHGYVPGAGTMTFWVQMPAAAAAHINARYYTMASIEATQTSLNSLGELWQEHPSLRMVSLKEMTQRFDDTLTLVTQIISGFAFVILSLACIVIISSVLTYEHQERKKNSIIMSFGLPQSTCLTINLIEWAFTGAVAALGAMFSTWVAGVLIYRSQFSMAYTPDFLWMAMTLTTIILTVLVVGYLASKRTLSSSIRELLTE